MQTLQDLKDGVTQYATDCFDARVKAGDLQYLGEGRIKYAPERTLFDQNPSPAVPAENNA